MTDTALPRCLPGCQSPPVSASFCTILFAALPQPAPMSLKILMSFMVPCRSITNCTTTVPVTLFTLAMVGYLRCLLTYCRRALSVHDRRSASVLPLQPGYDGIYSARRCGISSSSMGGTGAGQVGASVATMTRSTWSFVPALSTTFSLVISSGTNSTLVVILSTGVTMDFSGSGGGGVTTGGRNLVRGGKVSMSSRYSAVGISMICLEQLTLITISDESTATKRPTNQNGSR